MSTTIKIKYYFKLWAMDINFAETDHEENQHFSTLTEDDDWLDCDLPWLGERFEGK